MSEKHIKAIRENLEALGMDCSQFTDDELLEGIKKFGEGINKFGATMEHAGKAIKKAFPVSS